VLLALDRRLHGELVDVGAGDERLLTRTVNTIARTPASALNPAIAADSSFMVWVFSALRTLGRLKVTTATASSRSIRRFSKVIP
jgi:hypothetical protein